MSDSPRFLTNDEINSLLNRIAKPQISSSEIRDHVYNEVKTMFKYQLENIKLKPSKIEKMGDYISNRTERASYHGGTPVGFNVAESVSQPATQLVLNTFHSAGQSIRSPFDRFKEAINVSASKEKRFESSMNIHMRDKYISYEDLYIRAQQFVRVSISDLLEDSIIKEDYPFSDMSIYVDSFRSINQYTDHGYAIRLRFNMEKLFLHKITLSSIAKVLMELKNGSENYFTVFCGPQVEGIIDIYPIPDQVCDEFNKDFIECSKIFENGALTDFLQKPFSGDYDAISEARVEKVPMTDIIKDVTPHYVTDSSGTGEDAAVSPTHVRVWIDYIKVKKDGYPPEKLERLLRILKYNIVESESDENYLVVETDDMNLKATLTKILKDEDARLIEEFKPDEPGQAGFVHSSDLYLTGYYNYIVTKGSNLERVRLHKDVDEFNTISNNVMEIYDVLGLEVARSYIEKEIYDLFAEESLIVAPRNIGILVDWMTANIRPISVNPKNVLRPDFSVLRAINFEDPKTNIVKGAVIPTEEYVSNVSARIMLGIKQNLGTGAFKVIPNQEVIDLYEKISKKEDVGAVRLTSNTLRSGLNRSPAPTRPITFGLGKKTPQGSPAGSPAGAMFRSPAIPKPASDLFTESDLSKDDMDDFQI